MAKMTAKTAILAGGAGLLFIGGAWAFTSGSDDDSVSAADEQGTVFEADSSNNDRPENASSSEFSDAGPVIKMTFLEHDGPDKEKQVQGDIYLTAKYARTYNKNFYDHLVEADGSASVSSDAAARNYEADYPTDLLANDKFEIIVDYAANKRYVIDHLRKEIDEQTLVVTAGRPNTILNDAAKKDPEAAKRLAGLFGQFNKPRIDPKREFKLGGATGTGKSVQVNGQAVDCVFLNFLMSGGKAGKVCYADIDAVSGLADVRAILMEYPLPGAGKNDTLSRLRQFAEIGGSGRFPVSFKIRMSGLDGDDFDTDLTGFSRTERVIDPDAYELPKGYRRM